MPICVHTLAYKVMCDSVHNIFNFLPPDVDECAQNLDTCSQLCYDTSYSYTCSCYTGYTLSTDGITCIGKMNMLAAIMNLEL